MKYLISLLLLLPALQAFSQKTALFQDIETAVLKKGVKIMVWENEYSPKDDIRSWGVQKAECAAAWGTDTPEGKLITQASTADYVAVANQIRGDLMITAYNFPGNLREMGKDPQKWQLMKTAYQNAAFIIIREMYERTYHDGVMNAAGNWLIATEMIKACTALEGKPLDPLAVGTTCNVGTLAGLQQQMFAIMAPPARSVTSPETGTQWMLFGNKAISDKFKDVTSIGGSDWSNFQAKIYKFYNDREDLKNSPVVQFVAEGAADVTGAIIVIATTSTVATGGLSLLAIPILAGIIAIPVAITLATNQQALDIWVANYTGGELEVVDSYFQQGRLVTFPCNVPAQPIGARIPSANDPDKAYVGTFVFEKVFGYEGVIGGIHLRSKKDNCDFFLGFRLPYKVASGNDGVGNGCYCAFDTGNQTAILTGMAKYKTAEQFVKAEIIAGAFDADKLKGNISNKCELTTTAGVRYTIKGAVSNQYTTLATMAFQIEEKGYTMQKDPIPSYVGIPEPLYPSNKFVDLGDNWGFTGAMTCLNGYLFAAQGGHLRKTTFRCDEKTIDQNWSGIVRMTTIGNYFYSVQGGHLWQTDVNAVNKDLGANWGGIEAMTNLGGHIYAVQGGHLWKTDVTGKSTDLGANWGGTQAMTTLGNYIYAVQGGHLWKTDANGKSTDLGVHWDGTEAMASLGKYIYAVQGGHLWKTDANGKSTDLGAGWGGSEAMTADAAFIYIAKGGHLWAAKM